MMVLSVFYRTTISMAIQETVYQNSSKKPYCMNTHFIAMIDNIHKCAKTKVTCLQLTLMSEVTSK